jgi:hypothetical protein
LTGLPRTAESVAPSAAHVLLAVAFRARPPEALIDYLAGTMPLE